MSDLRAPLPDNQVRARLTWPGGARVWTFEGDVEADSCAHVGVLRQALPAEARAGRLTLELDLEWFGGRAHNSYESHVSIVTDPAGAK